MNEHDGLLDFLTDGLVGRERDAVTRAFYQYAQGDPDSHPVGISVLLTACMRQLAHAPEKLQSASAAFQQVVADARELERRLIERVDGSNAGVITAIREEANRAKEAWRETMEQNLRMGARIREEATDMTNAMKPVVAATKQIALDLPTLQSDLKLQNESAKRIAEGVELIQLIDNDIQAFAKQLTREIRANWTMTALGFGMALEYALLQLQPPLHPWVGLVVFTVAAAFIQGFFRWFWTLGPKQSKKVSPPAETKPPG